MKRLLIANRGEIAARISRTAQAMGIKTVAVFSDSDRNSWHRKLTDESVHIGKSAPKESYLAMERILQAAIDTNCDFIHPGYGFLSENIDFIRLVEEVSLIRIKWASLGQIKAVCL